MTLHFYRFGAFHKVALQLSVLVVALGVTVLLGWAFDIAALKSVFPGLATMKANTALGMLVCGVALALLSRKKIGMSTRFCTTGMAMVVIACVMLRST